LQIDLTTLVVTIRKIIDREQGMKKWILAALLVASQVQAGEFITGNLLAPTDDTFVGAYTAGVMDSILAVNSNAFCIPAGVNAQQAGKVVRKYLSDHPEKLHLSAAVIVFEAMAQAFSCK
jgi:hypothetical protein